VARSIEFRVFGAALLTPSGKTILPSYIFTEGFDWPNSFTFLALLSAELRGGLIIIYNCHVV
jgi:hypothetical protein